MRPEPLTEACIGCPGSAVCLGEKSCRATWDSWAAADVADAIRTAARKYRCPHCHAPPGTDCPLARAAACWPRMKLAQADLTAKEAS